MLITKEDIGKRLWDSQEKEWVSIVDFEDREIYPVVLKNTKNHRYECTIDGKNYIHNVIPRYFWDNVCVSIPDHRERPDSQKIPDMPVKLTHLDIKDIKLFYYANGYREALKVIGKVINIDSLSDEALRRSLSTKVNKLIEEHI